MKGQLWGLKTNRNVGFFVALSNCEGIGDWRGGWELAREEGGGGTKDGGVIDEEERRDGGLT